LAVRQLRRAIIGSRIPVYWRGVEAEIQRNRRALEELLCCLQESLNEEAEYMNTETAMRVTTYDLAPQLVLCISKRVKIDGLEEHIRETPKRLIAFADAQPSGRLWARRSNLPTAR